ncbi:adenosylcobinamide kinase /adenosylcobinamide-phosphate guanylyltransferase [Meinhardsimonia xiamenensis]|jgi:adenosylcobinamide kinase/adenosylcobinamide-phosphate guanylyltransferase|uniref:Bifunctional adenosylcobalamin biosynthesis protein n=1 Tax=Meinhardsimonia xiamenensis TaxID=990712 RepID=A0A1G8ZDB1_9RHOB|nr:bifunctional adenosylcobinamide kinase/adenosylcobinamide-phosphate guanylyltransferase [Meinhardsimonia xiamenensis]PRX37662.1 adenosylcobinamide kinase /adenosylcobinamide-phosphate guanylyltransferase [Meinhardsimonia xiamenensis]SDK13116.1 adenosylcobinamide kinase /adenosylcobinamide-phosphate guanylyltransferase [Meinhardsimonia xiamenensis]
MQTLLPALSLVIGGARSGKSTFAERLVMGSGLAPVYVATAEAGDDPEMAARIAAHKARRGRNWREVEAGRALGAALGAARPGEAVLIDCITLWLTGILLAGDDLETAEEELLAALRSCAAPVVVVSSEVGAGIVPENALARRFRDAQGRLNQTLAARADLAVAVVAGLPLVLKGALPEALR